MSSRSLEVVVASVMGLLEERETAARVRVEGLRAEADRVLAALREAEVVLERRVVAVEELAEALDARAPAESVEQAGGVEPVPVVVKPAKSGAVVPHRRAGTAVEVLAPDYRRIVALVEADGAAAQLRVKDLACGLGLELVPQVAGVGAVGPQTPQAAVPRPQRGQHPAGGLAVGDGGRGDQHLKQQPERVHDDVPLAAVILSHRNEDGADQGQCDVDGVLDAEESRPFRLRRLCRPACRSLRRVSRTMSRLSLRRNGVGAGRL